MFGAHPLTSSPGAAAPVAVLHAPTQRYLGSTFVLADADDALVFDSVDAAASFLARHGSEPCYEVVELAPTTLAA